MKLFKYLFYLLVIVILLVTFTPLNIYYGKLEKHIKPLKLNNISGSAIKGSAQSVKYFGLDLGKASWLNYPSSYNAMTMDLSINNDQYDLETQYIKTPQSDTLKNLKGTIDWQMINQFVNFNRGEITGYVQLDFQKLEMRKGVPYMIIGKAISRDLKLIKPIKKDLGEIEVVFTNDNPEILVGQVNSQSNVLNVSGAIYIHTNHRWEVKLTLLPMPGEYEVEYALQNIGDRRRGGGRSLNLAGFY